MEPNRSRRLDLAPRADMEGKKYISTYYLSSPSSSFNHSIHLVIAEGTSYEPISSNESMQRIICRTKSFHLTRQTPENALLRGHYQSALHSNSIHSSRYATRLYFSPADKDLVSSLFLICVTLDRRKRFTLTLWDVTDVSRLHLGQLSV